jgi:hypothetical protein
MAKAKPTGHIEQRSMHTVAGNITFSSAAAG